METITLNFKASGQNLTADAHPQRYASNTVNYIQAVFDLDENWQSFDSVRAVWHNDFACISTVLDVNGACTVPHEVLTNLDEVIVNLVGSNVEGEELVDRMTTYPLRVVIIDAHARICGTETAEVTPSQFEQYVAIVSDLVHSVKDIDRIELNEDYTLTVYFSDETSWTSTSIRGEQGETGNGIASAVLNDDYTLTLNFTDDTSYTTPSIRGEQGPQGEPGEVTLAQLEQVLPTDTASGAIASFPDGSDLFDYLSCICDINPVQDLHGYDKPWVGGAGKNKVNNSTNIEGFYTATGNYNYNTDFRTTDLIEVLPSTQYNGALYNNGIYVNKAFATLWDSDGNFIQQETDESFTTTATTKFVRLRNSQSDISVVTSNTYAFQLEKGNTHTSYEPYSNLCPITGWTGCEVVVSPTEDAQDGTTYPVSWQTEAGTVYGGTVDLVTGVLTAYPYYTSYNGETLVGPWVSSMDEYIEGRIPTTGAQVVDLGGTPTTYQLTPTQIHALLGQNNVWADCGDVEVQYKADVQRWVEKMLNA